MRINKLVLKNFGLYRGLQEIDLCPRTKYRKTRPIVLVGGHNGAGKTTILEALRLCLYGKLALGERVREQDYQLYLRDRVHRNRLAPFPASASSVFVEFEFSRGGARAIYGVERAWDISRCVVDEQLSVTRDGRPLDDVDSEHWSDFLRSMIPPGLSQLFFFDGEKIQKLAEDTSDSATLGEAVKALLGLDLVERLQADLDLYVSRETRRAATGERAGRLNALTAELETLDAQLQVAKQEEASQRTHLDYLQKEVETLEQQLAMQGSGLAGQRTTLKERKRGLEQQLGELSKSLSELFETSLPFAVCPTICGLLEQQLVLEEESERWEAGRRQVVSALEEVGSHLTEARTASRIGLDRTKLKTVREEISRFGEELTAPPESLKNFELLHGLSSAERQGVIGAIRGSASKVASARTWCRAYAAAELERTSTQQKLTRAPTDEEISPLVERLSDLHKQEVALQITFAAVAQNRAALESSVNVRAREQKNLEELLQSEKHTSERVEVATRTRRSLDDYLRRITALKVSQLEAATMDCFAQLCRKGDLVRAIHIDPVSFRVELADETGRRVPKSELSAGEKQIYAISVLWALARVSGRPLPMIIDTPLARLDSIHRLKLIESYFPRASHQVVILSTDTEIDLGCYQTLRPSVSHTINLVNHPGGWTEAVQGYFGQVQEESDHARA